MLYWKLLNFYCAIALGSALQSTHSALHCTYSALQCTSALHTIGTAVHILEVSTVLRLFVTAVDNPHTQQCSAQVQVLYLRATAPLPLFPNFLRFRFPACPHFSPLPIYESWVKMQTSDIVPFVKRLIVQKLCIVVLSLN